MVTSLTPPGPKGDFLTGHMREFHRDPFNFVTRCAREYGDIVRVRLLFIPAYFIFHPDHVESVLATNNRNFIKPRPVRTPFFKRMVGNGLLSSENSFWLRQRRLVQPAFHKERIASYGAVAVAQAGRMLVSWQDGQILDVHQEMMRLTLGIVTKSLFDADISQESANVGEAINRALEPFASIATLRWYLDNRLPTPGHKRFHRAMQQLDEIIFQIIRGRRASGQDQGDLLSELLRAEDEDGHRMTDQQLRDEVFTLILAGHETTALALTWAWYLLAEHPEVERKLAAEIESVLQGRTPGVADIQRLPYTEMVIKESLRLYPPGWAIGRQAVRACEVGGYQVPAGMQIYMFQWVLHRDPRYFSEPEEFRPERWSDDLARRLPRFAYFPFGGGPRVCIGNAFAMMEAILLLATIAQKFRLKLEPEQLVKPLASITLRPQSGIKVRVEKRSRLAFD
jgi:cytochrome P450